MGEEGKEPISLEEYRNQAEVFMIKLDGMPIPCGNCGEQSVGALIVHDPKAPLPAIAGSLLENWQSRQFFPFCEPCYIALPKWRFYHGTKQEH